jgi:hypothetical protein
MFSPGQHLNVLRWIYRSITSNKIAIIFPAASTTRIGATAAKFTVEVDGAASAGFEVM